jgi:hypothetical protein
VGDKPNCGSSESHGMRAELFLEARNKLQPSIRNYHLHNSVQAYHASNIDLSILLNLVVGLDGYGLGGFGDLINDHPNQVKLASNERQSHNEVHSNVIPLPNWNTQRL